MTRSAYAVTAWFDRTNRIRNTAVQKMVRQAIECPSAAERLLQYNASRNMTESPIERNTRLVYGLLIIASMRSSRLRSRLRLTNDLVKTIHQIESAR